MNHTGVNTYGLSQVVKDEANRFLDAVEIGTDEEFVVCATEILSRHEFESKGYCRVPCTIGKVYIKQYLPRNHHKNEIVYRTNLSTYGRMLKCEFMRSVIIMFSDFVSVELTRDVHSDGWRVISERIQSISMRSF